MPINSILLGICQSTASRLIAKALEKPVKSIFAPDATYEKRLSRIIKETIEEYESRFPIQSGGKKFPFYHSKDIFEILSEHELFETNRLPELDSAYEKYPNIIRATNEQLQIFYSLFIENVNKDGELKQLFAESKYKEKVIEINSSVKEIAAEIKEVSSAVEEIAHNFRQDDLPVVIPYFISRKEEKDLGDILLNKDVLLLTGISFCGKSQLAKKTAISFIKQGYKYSYSDDVGEAIRFLRNSSNRIFLLEDPFGHNSQSENEFNIRKVKELIDNLPKGNKLIITSRIEVLKSIMSASSVEECSMGSNSWIDLTNHDATFLLDVWAKLCEKNAIPTSIDQVISKYLSDSNYSGTHIQVGQLVHLTNISIERLLDKNLETLLYLASADSKDIGIEIGKRGTSSYELFMTLGLGASTTISMNLDELSFILSESSSEPGFVNRDNNELRSYTYAERGSLKETTFPQYPSGLKLSSDILTELDFLQRRGFISIIEERITFTHPTYREAARYLLLSNSVLYDLCIERIARKVIVCLNPTTVLSCVKQLGFIYQNTLSEERKKIIRELAIAASRYSIFPGVRDNAFTFLLEILSDLNIDTRDRILSSLQRRVSSSDVLWHRDIPYISPGSTVGFFDHLRDPAPVNDLEHTLNRINSNECVPLSKVWDLILAIQNGTFNKFPSSSGLKYILNCDEVFVRQKIAHLILIRSFPEDEKILQTIFSDDHPAVIFEGMKAVILKFASFDISERKILLPLLISGMSKPMIIARANNFFSSFGIDYGSESIHWPSINEKDKKIIWALWGQLFPLFLKYYPRGIRFPNTGRFGASLNESIKYISKRAGIEICNEYFNWLERFLEISEPDTYEFGLLPYLLDVTSKNTIGRFEIIKKIFLHRDTRFVTYSLSWSLSYWEDLTEKEKKFILKTLGSARLDTRWLLATAITRSTVPGEIIEQIFKDKYFLDKDIPTLVNGLPPQLLEDSLSIFFGYPQPLGYLGLNHTQNALWIKITEWILLNEYSVGFDLCLREFVSNGVNGFISKIKPSYNVWVSLCKSSSNKKQLAERLIFETARSSCNLDSAKNFWTALIDGYKESGQLSELSDLIVANIIMLQAYNPEDLLEFFDYWFIDNELMARMSFDRSLLHLLWLVNHDKIGSEKVCDEINSLLAKHSSKELRLLMTYERIRHTIASSAIKYPCLSSLDLIENPITLDSEARKKLFDEKDELTNWVSVRKIE